MPEKILKKSYINNTYGSAASFELVTKSVDIPDDIEGKIIIDLGSSVSNAVKRFNELGARAYGVDYQYRGLAHLIQSVEPSFTSPDRWGFPIARHIDPVLRGGENPDFVEVPKNPFTRAWKGLSELKDDFLKYGLHAQYLRKSEKVYREFLEDYHSDQRSGQYIAGRFEHLPFADNTADLIYSVAALSIFVISDKKAFLQSMKEAFRVAKPGAPILIDPWYDSANPVWDRNDVNNSKRFMSFMKSSGITFTHENERLAITAPKK